MFFQEYEAVDSYRQAVVPFLEEREAVNNLPLGIVSSLEERIEEGSKPFLGAVKDDQGQVILVALRTPPHNLVLAGHGPRTDQALEVAVAHLHEEQIIVPGVIGLKGIAETFTNRWSEITGDRVVVSMEQRIYRLDAVSPISRASGRLRPATIGDAELVANWMKSFSAEAVAKELAPDKAREQAEGIIGQRRLYLWEDGKTVSMAASSRQTRNGIVINWVHTPAEFRQRGYATSCVAALSQLLLDKGSRFCSLYTDLANPTSNSIYSKIGYRPIGDSVVYSFRRDDD